MGQRATLQNLWTFISRTVDHAFFDQSLQKAKAAALRPITKIAEMLQHHLLSLLNYITHRVTNAVTEGFNAKII